MCAFVVEFFFNDIFSSTSTKISFTESSIFYTQAFELLKRCYEYMHFISLYFVTVHSESTIQLINENSNTNVSHSLRNSKRNLRQNTSLSYKCVSEAIAKFQWTNNTEPKRAIVKKKKVFKKMANAISSRYL